MANGLVLDNPILESYVKGLQMRRQKEQTDFENALQVEAGKRADLQLKGYLENLDKQHEFEQQRIDQDKLRLEMERNAHELQARHTLAQMFSSGQATQRAPTMGEANSSPVGGMIGGVDPRTIQYATPQDLTQQAVSRASQLGDVQASVAGKTAGAEAAAKEPYNALKRVSEHQQEMEKQLLVGQQALERTNAEIAGRKAVAQIEAKAGMDRTRLMYFGGFDDPKAATSAVMPFVTGDAEKPLGNTPRDMAMRNLLQKSGFKEVTAKDKTELKKMALLDPIFQLQHEFLTQFAPQGNLEAAKQLLVSKIPTTELNNFKARIRSAGGVMANSLDAQTGRMANQEIERILGGLGVPGKTFAQAQQDFDFMRARVSSKMLDNVLGDVPEKQKLIILKDMHRDPSQFTIEYNGKNIPRYRQDPSDGEWLIFDPKKKGYVSIDAQ